MKKNKGFILKSVCGEKFLIAEGEENIDFTNLIALNESSAYLWEAISENEEFDEKTLANLLLKEYDVDEETALKDAAALIKTMSTAGIIS